MTAAELFKVVEHVPREAWPRGMSFTGRVWCPNHIPPDIAADAFVGSMVSYIIEDNSHLPFKWGGAYHLRSDESLNAKYSHPGYTTFLEALAAACKQIGTK